MRAAAQMAASSPAAVEGTLEAASLHLPSSSVGSRQKEEEGLPCPEAVEGTLEEVAVAAAQ